jgi:predicted enzyme related to lactoylglutathione lyase
MFEKTQVLHSFSVNDIAEAKRFYAETLGLDVKDGQMGNLEITFGDGSQAFAYEKNNERGVPTKIYADNELPGMPPSDDKGIIHGDDTTPQIAWFKDPAGNVIAVLANE